MKDTAPNWPRPLVLPLPEHTRGVQQPVLSLAGPWQHALYPPALFWEPAASADWPTTAVPGPVFAPRDALTPPACGYVTTVTIPSDFGVPGDPTTPTTGDSQTALPAPGGRIFLKLDGVGGYAQLWVNDTFVRDHFGGFTPWCAEISALVTPGQPATIAVRTESRRLGVLHTDLSILREPLLVALPPDFIAHFHVDTELDETFQNAVLRIHTGLDFSTQSPAQVEYHLTDASGHAVPLAPNRAAFSPDQPAGILEISLTGVRTWDAEHPTLYTLQASLLHNGETTQIVSRQIGFRKIEVRGRNVWVNGQPVKLRGVNRHDIWPLTGRAVTAEQCERDAHLFKEANINFIRTSHYPPNEAFLAACDRVGLYVEDEIAVMFVKTHEHNDPDFSPLFMGQFSEMIERDRSHPSVLLWSMGNESAYGRNIRQQIEYVRREDPTRPIIFSWGDLMPFDPQPPVDIFSLHYAYYDADPGQMSDLWVGTAWNTGIGKNFTQAAQDQAQGDLPILHDEVAHIPAYDVREQMRDPGVRAFWGETIHRFWEAIFPRDGALGAAIWAGIDDLILDPQVATYPHFEWGVLDPWKRPKPEYWLAKKAFSPIRIREGAIPNPGSGQPARIPIKNWFDHTYLNEISVRWQAGAQRGELPGPALAPHSAGELLIPARAWVGGEMLNLAFYTAGGLLLDEYNLPVGQQPAQPAQPGRRPPVQVQDDEQFLRLSGADFELRFSKASGLITAGSWRGIEVIKSGPHLHLEGVTLADWRLKSFGFHSEQGALQVEISGAYGTVEVRFALSVDGSGQIITRYTLDTLPNPPLPKPWVQLSSDVGGFREVGLSFVLTSAVDRLTWRRKGYWSAYPLDHIARPAGTALRESPGEPFRFDQSPTWPWSQDARNIILYGRYDPGGRGTNDFRSLKENIYTALAVANSPGSTQAGLRAEADGDSAVRLELLDDPQALIDERDPRVKWSGDWQRMEDDPRCYARSESLSKTPGSTAEVEFNGTGICWIGSRDTYYGKADVYIDGQFAAEIDLFSGSTNWDMPLGQDKLPRAYLFSKEGLPAGAHSLRIVVRGDKNPQAHNTFVAVDAFQVLGGPSRAEVRAIINNLWNYPEIGWVRWGNYTRDAVLLEPGYSNQVKVRLCDGEI